MAIETIPTSEVIEVNNYPYGSLKCTAYFGIEFHPKKGFRSTFQTVNPKTGRLNAVKKSTYSDILLQYREEGTGHIKVTGLDMNGSESLNKAVKFMSEHFDKFTPQQIEYIYTKAFTFAIVSLKSMVIYCGSKFEDLKPLFDPFIKNMKKGMKEKTNVFADVLLDIEKIEAIKDPNFNPFRTTTYKIG